MFLRRSDTGAGRDLQDKRVFGREKRFLSRPRSLEAYSPCVCSARLVLPTVETRDPSFTDSAAAALSDF